MRLIQGESGVSLRRRRRRQVMPTVLGVVLAVLVTMASTGPVAAKTPPPVSNWVPSGTTSFTPVAGTPQVCGGQGIASDGNSLWFSWNFGLSRNDLDLTKTFAARCTDAIPAHLAATQHNHIGDIDIHDGILYAPIEDGPAGYLSPWMVLYRASDLTATGKAFELERSYLTEGVPWVAIDAPRKVAYTAEWNNTTKLNVHRLSDFKVIRTVDLDKTVPRIQGAKVFRGSLYIARDNRPEHSVEAIDPETGHVTHLFDRPELGDSEAEGIAFIRRKSGTVMTLLELYQGARLSNYRINGDTTPPKLSGLKLRPMQFRAKKRPVALLATVHSTEPAAVTGQWLRCVGSKRKPCKRLRKVGKPFDRTLTTGSNRISLKAAAKGKKLAPGKWRLRLTPTDEADITGKHVEARLTVLSARKRR